MRSDAYCEDDERASHAGSFLSILDVEHDQLESAIDRVAASLPGHPADAVMVQLMVTGIEAAGVAATHRIEDGAPWYCLDMAENATGIVTEGRACTTRTSIARDEVQRTLGRRLLCAAEQLALTLLLEVEQLCESKPVEIEFAIRRELAAPFLRAYLLQVRPISTAHRWKPADVTHSRLPPLAFLHATDPLPDVAGARTVLSLMADWNPAELIGEHPRPLSLSLFQRLIARGVWWNARSALGYAAIPGTDVALLHVLRGRPLVDVRRSANSMLPRVLPMATRRRIVDRWISRLYAAPALHDKVEFEVYRTVRDFRASDALRHEWSPVLGTCAWREWEHGLGALTEGLMASGPASLLNRYLRTVESLEGEATRCRSWPALLDRCQVGTASFASLARVAFAAEAQLRSAVERSAISPDRAHALRASSRGFPLRETVAGRNVQTEEACTHLRPGTFDITQPTWPARFRQVDDALGDVKGRFILHATERHALQLLLREASLPLDADEWVRFAQTSFRAREHSKFVFSRYLSAALDDITRTFDQAGLDQECASWLTLEEIADAPERSSDARSRFWLERSGQAQLDHDTDSRMILSPLLRGEADRFVATSLETLPNFIGRHAVQGPVVPLDVRVANMCELQGSIVVVRQADPGFDWLFAHGIAGLITAWGGANSHLAIRCAEFGLSAAIGCGESVFARAAQAQHARLDPAVGGLWLH